MKKITLLLVTAVFAIGIQSCSTEEDVLIEESVIKKENNIPENAIYFGSENINKGPNPIGIYKRVFVRYPIGSSYQFRLNHATQVGPQFFDDFYVIFNNGCDFVDEWYIKCYTCSDIEKGTASATNHDDIDEVELEDEDFDPENDDPVYWECSDVPVTNPFENISILDNDGNNDQGPCRNCAGTPIQ